MSCSAELDAMNTCVTSDAACTSCFDPGAFMDTYPKQAEDFFRSVLAFANPGDDEFCVEASWRICKKYYPLENGEASCCCLVESKAYTACMYGTNGNGWLSKYSVTNTSCVYGGCEIFDLEGTLDEGTEEGGDGGGSSVIIIGGGAGGAVLVAILVVCLYLRKRRLAAVGDDDDDDDEEKAKKKKKKPKDKDKDKDKKKDKKKKKDDSDDDSDDSDAKSKKKGKKKKKKKKKKDDSDDDSDDSDAKSKKKKKKKKKKKDDSDSDSSGSSSSDSDDSHKKSKKERRRRNDDDRTYFSDRKTIDTRSTAEMTDWSRMPPPSYAQPVQTMPIIRPMIYSEYDYHGLRNSRDIFEDEQALLLSAKRAAKLARFESRMKTSKLSSLKGVHKETAARLIKAKQKAKKIEKKAVSEIEQTEKEKMKMSRSMRKLKREKEKMAEKLAVMEEERSESKSQQQHNLQQQQQQQQQQQHQQQQQRQQRQLEQQQMLQTLIVSMKKLQHEQALVSQNIAQLEAQRSTYGLQGLVQQRQALQQQIYLNEVQQQEIMQQQQQDLDLDLMQPQQQQQDLMQMDHPIGMEHTTILQQQNLQQNQYGMVGGGEVQNPMDMGNMLMMQQQQQQASVYGIDQSVRGNGYGFHEIDPQQSHTEMNTLSNNDYNDLVTIGQQQFGQNSTVTGGLTVPPPVRIVNPKYSDEDDISSFEGGFYKNSYRGSSKQRPSSSSRSNRNSNSRRSRSSRAESSSTRKSRGSSRTRNTSSRNGSRSQSRNRSERSRSISRHNMSGRIDSISDNGMDPDGRRSPRNINSSSRHSRRSHSSSSIDYTGNVRSNRKRTSPRERSRR